VWARMAGSHKFEIALGLALIVALWVGGIRIDWRGAAIVGGAGLLLALWRVATDRALGPRISQKLGGLGPVFVLSLLSPLIMTLRAMFQDLHDSAAERIGAISFLVCVLLVLTYLATLLLMWLFRERWAGALVFSTKALDERGPIAFILGVYSILIVRDLMRGEGKHPGTVDRIDFYGNIALIISIIALGACLWMVRGLEVRDRGIVFRGRLISWLDIEGYEWEPVIQTQALLSVLFRPKMEVLRLNVARRFTFLPPPKIRITEEKDELDAILKRHLSPWPE
jgi:hypothetical protein